MVKIEQLKNRNKKAFEAIYDACENNKFTLKVSIPANLESDQDIVVCMALEDCELLIKEIEKLRVVAETATDMKNSYWNKDAWSSFKIGPLTHAIKSLEELENE